MKTLIARLLVATLPSLAGCLYDTTLADRSDGGARDAAPVDTSSPGAHHAWSKRLDTMAVHTPPRVALDRAGNAYVWSVGYGPVDFGGGPLGRDAQREYILASFAADGSYRWSLGVPFVNGGVTGDVTTDDAGNVYIAGSFSESLDVAGAHLTSAGELDVLVASFTSTGAPRWARSFGGMYSDRATRVRVDASGHVVVAGEFNVSIDFGGGPLVAVAAIDLFLASFTRDGAYRWARSSGSGGLDTPTSLGVAPDGTITLGGMFGGTADFGGGPLTSTGGSFDSDMFVASYTAEGAHRWSRRYGTPELESLNGLTVNARGDVFLVGATGGATDFGGGPLARVAAGNETDVFVASLDRDGAHRWSHRYGTAGEDGAMAAALDASGNVHVTGYFGRNLDVGPSIALGGALLPSAGLTDLFVASYSADGAHRASRTYGTRRRDEGAGIAVDANGDVLVTGLFASPRDVEAGDTVDFGSGPITATSTHDAFLTRLAP